MEYLEANKTNVGKIHSKRRRNPWGKVHKIVTEQPKKDTSLVSLEKQNGTFTEIVKEKLPVMIEELLPYE